MRDQTLPVRVHVTVLRTTPGCPPEPAKTGLTHAFAVALILAVGILRIVYLLYACPYDLAPDEAHYWDWSRHLDWSYYSKGPLVAWLIRASCAIFGDTMPAVRLPAVLCGSLTLLGLYLLTLQVYGSARLALGVVALGLTFPVLAAGSLLMTIDAPFVCCWTWALVAAHRLLCSQRAFGLHVWALLGLLIGLGILAKYTMAVFIPSLLLFLALGARSQPSEVRGQGRGLALAGVVAAACCLPILIWNAQHDWITFLHVGRQAGIHGDSGLRWLGPLEFIAGQAGLLLGFAFVWWLFAMVRYATFARTQPLPPLRKGWTDDAFLWWMSAPMFVVFLLFSLKTQVELNWAVTAYISGLVLAAGWVVRQCRSPRPGWRAWSRGCLAAAALLGFIVTLFLHRTDFAYSLVDGNPRSGDPTCRLRGWQTLAGEVDAARKQLRAEGIEPVLVATGWQLPGEVAFYLPDQPHVHSIALACGGRRSQYDFRRPNPVWDPEAFLGATFVCIGELPAGAMEAFDRLDWRPEVIHETGGHVVARWRVTVCRGFRGFRTVPAGGY